MSKKVCAACLALFVIAFAMPVQAQSGRVRAVSPVQSFLNLVQNAVQNSINTIRRRPSNPTPIPPPGPGVTTVYTCGEINRPGKYVLDRDIFATRTPCINMHDTQDVSLDCAKHFIQGVSDPGSPVAEFQNLNRFSVSNCNLIGSVLRMDASANGAFGNNETSVDVTIISNSDHVSIFNNRMRGPLSMTQNTNSSFDGNTLVFVKSVNTCSVFGLWGGANNMVRNNTIDGASDGIFHSRTDPCGGNIGSDDGITIQDESGDIISNNTIKNSWDCGIETTGSVSNTLISNNNILNSGEVCGIGGWYNTSWSNNTVSGNVVSQTTKLFVFSRIVTMPGGAAVFTNNKFLNNKFSNATHSGVGYETIGAVFDFSSRPEMVTAGNEFSGNDFNTSVAAPRILPFGMAVDNGGNICGQPALGAPPNPIKCTPANLNPTALRQYAHSYIEAPEHPIFPFDKNGKLDFKTTALKIINILPNLLPAEPEPMPPQPVNKAPYAMTGDVSDIVQGYASLDGIVQPNGLATDYYFVYGTSQSSLDRKSQQRNIAAGDTPSGVSAKVPISNASGTVYYYQLIAENALGSNRGDIKSFNPALSTPGTGPKVTVPSHRFNIREIHWQ